MYNEQNKHLDSMFILGGIDKNNELILFQRGRDENKMTVKTPENIPQVTYLPNEEAMVLDFDSIIGPRMYKLIHGKGKITPNKVLKLHLLLNSEVEKVDSTVGKKTRELIIKRE
ncbi:hypothetical protein [Metabacillus sediminilitoris]|nr:hypothetical protein [Metabacillus sediminilitoris]